jgi:hypothetical protein
MSYDLFFVPRQNKPRIGLEAFQEYFRDRPWYKAPKAHAGYTNEDTGVYFSFTYEEDANKNDDSGEEGDSQHNTSFNLNYYRSHVFGLEAEPEVTAFVNHFEFLIDDPQNDGMGRGKYSPDGFLQGWNAGNRVAYEAILTSERKPDRVDTLPADEIERYWRWNLDRGSLQEEVSAAVFVPKIMFLQHDGRVQSFVVWSEAIPTTFPPVDLVLLYRKQLSRLRLAEGESDFALCTWQEMGNQSLPFKRGPKNSYVLDYDEPPRNVVDFFTAKTRYTEKLQRLSEDEILDEELVREFQ